jgi:hypothetical protein
METDMNRFLLTATGLSLIFMTALVNAAEPQMNAPADLKLTDEQCSTLWTKARGESIGELKLDEAKPYLKDFTKADIDESGSLDSKEWSDACKAGLVSTSPMVPAEVAPDVR